jgi:hypothetical protein
VKARITPREGKEKGGYDKIWLRCLGFDVNGEFFFSSYGRKQKSKGISFDLRMEKRNRNQKQKAAWSGETARGGRFSTSFSI